MNRKEKAIKILSKIESLQHYYCKYVLFSKGELSLIDLLKNNPNAYITMMDFECKAYHKLYPIATMEEKGAPSMYLLTKELYEAKENMFYDALEDSLNDTETLCQHLKRKKEESELLKNLNNI